MLYGQPSEKKRRREEDEEKTRCTSVHADGEFWLAHGNLNEKRPFLCSTCSALLSLCGLPAIRISATPIDVGLDICCIEASEKRRDLVRQALCLHGNFVVERRYLSSGHQGSLSHYAVCRQGFGVDVTPPERTRRRDLHLSDCVR